MKTIVTITIVAFFFISAHAQTGNEITEKKSVERFITAKAIGKTPIKVGVVEVVFDKKISEDQNRVYRFYDYIVEGKYIRVRAEGGEFEPTSEVKGRKVSNALIIEGVGTFTLEM